MTIITSVVSFNILILFWVSVLSKCLITCLKTSVTRSMRECKFTLVKFITETS